MAWIYALIGVGVGILVGFMGVGGGVILIPALVYGMHMQQHIAQGTSLFLQLPPLGVGALLMYWKRGKVDWVAGGICALGILLGGYFGSEFAIGLSSKALSEWFGVFLIVAAVLLWRKSNPRPAAAKAAE
ncbi:MAG: sulfite exporter TauE/SafE family protein [Acidobacteriia bacterium]|nr:sulfite exporter TauE/SafE family protein [Terriglobia bacterium]